MNLLEKYEPMLPFAMLATMLLAIAGVAPAVAGGWWLALAFVLFAPCLAFLAGMLLLCVVGLWQEGMEDMRDREKDAS